MRDSIILSLCFLLLGSYSFAQDTLIVRQDTIGCSECFFDRFGTSYQETGAYYYYTQTVNGCDSVAQLNLAIYSNPETSILEVDSILQAESNATTYLWSTGDSTSSIAPNSNGSYWLVITDSIGCVSDTAFYNYQNHLAIKDLVQAKKLLRIIDVLGRETKPQPNIPLFYIYDDGTVEKRIMLE